MDKIKKSLKERKKEYKEKHKEFYKKYQREYIRKYNSTLIGVYKKYKAGAKRRNLDFDLTLEYFTEFWQANCYYCGDKLLTVGFDRIDNDIGYVENNVLPACRICNVMKLTYTQEDFLMKCKQIVDKHFKEG